MDDKAQITAEFLIIMAIVVAAAAMAAASINSSSKLLDAKYDDLIKDALKLLK